MKIRSLGSLLAVGLFLFPYVGNSQLLLNKTESEIKQELASMASFDFKYNMAYSSKGKCLKAECDLFLVSYCFPPNKERNPIMVLFPKKQYVLELYIEVHDNSYIKISHNKWRRFVDGYPVDIELKEGVFTWILED